MEKANTKEKILSAALELFSVNGYEASSISQIADAVGIRKASLYSHFSGKQEILDQLTDYILEQYSRHSIFVNANWENPDFADQVKDLTPEGLTGLVKRQMSFILHDPLVRKGRKMLVIEQYRNEKLSKLQTKQNYTDVLHYNEGMMKYLIRKGLLKDEDPEMMALQFSAPITQWIALCDREPEREDEVMQLLERHINQFLKMYGR